MIDSITDEEQPRRREIQRRLAQAVAPNLLSYYRDAVQILFGRPQLENASHFVAHAMRDIESGVRRLLLSLLLTSDERNDLDKRAQAQKRDEGSHELQIRTILGKLSVADDDRIARIWLGVAGKRNIKGLHGRAHRRDLRPAPPIDPQWWTELEDLLEFQLDAIERHHASFFPLLDELAAKEKPTAADITKINNEIPNTYVMRRAFYEMRLNQPGWLGELRAAGIFRRMPQEETDFDRRGQPLPWPETDYLARMATHSPVALAVMEIALEIDTENEYVHHDLLRAALSVDPPSIAAPLALREAKWISSRERLWYPVFPERVADLVIRLASVRDQEIPFALARAMLEIRKAQIPPGQQPEPARLLDDEPIAVRLDEYDYQRAVERMVPALLTLDSRRTLELFVFLLDAALRAHSKAEGISGKDDGSTWWRRFVDSDEEGPRPYESALVSAFLKAARERIAREPEKAEDLVSDLEGRGWSIFRRIALHLVTVVGGDLARKRICDSVLFDDDDASREYAELVRSRFGEVDDADRQRYYALVEKGPELSWLEEERRATYLRAWQVRRLRLVAAHLPDALRQAFPELARPEQVDVAVGEGSHAWTGRAAPSLTTAALLERPALEAVALLRDWQPRDGWGEAGRSDVANEFAGAVASDPARFADHALTVEGVDQIYARSFFNGLERGLKEGRAFRWAPVLGLASWITEQRAGPGNDKSDGRVYEHALVDLIGEGLQPREAEIPFAERERVWRVIERLNQGSSIDEGLEKSDPMTASLSTTRGGVVHATVLYALWVRRHIERRPGDEPPVAGFDEVPEARSLLEARLDPAFDSSLATRGALGYRMTQLTYLDANWVRDHRDALFPKATEHRRLRKATRETYLAWSGIFSSVIETLAEEYRDAFSGASAQPPVDHITQQAEQRLPEHLAIVYLRGHFAIDHALVEDFLAMAPPRMRAGLIESMGRLLAHESTEAVHLERGRAFWEHRRRRLESSGQAGDEEAASFGFWFGLEGLPIEWRLREMRAAVNIALWTEPDGIVMEKLAELAPNYPSETLAVAEVMAAHPKERWQIDYWMPDLRQVITVARYSGNENLMVRAKELVSKLIVAGHLALSDLA